MVAIVLAKCPVATCMSWPPGPDRFPRVQSGACLRTRRRRGALASPRAVAHITSASTRRRKLQSSQRVGARVTRTLDRAKSGGASDLNRRMAIVAPLWVPVVGASAFAYSWFVPTAGLRVVDSGFVALAVGLGLKIGLVVCVLAAVVGLALSFVGVSARSVLLTLVAPALAGCFFISILELRHPAQGAFDSSLSLVTAAASGIALLLPPMVASGVAALAARLGRREGTAPTAA